MTFKPQMGLLIPFALMAGGYWRTFLVAALTTVIFAGASLAVLGMETWTAFLEQSTFARQTLSDGLVSLHKFVSVYGSARLLGATVAEGYGAQLLVSLATLGVVITTWRSQACFEAKAIVLVGAGLLATPFVLSYDLAVIAVPLAYLLKLHGSGRRCHWDISLALIAVLVASSSRAFAEVLNVPLGPFVGLLLVIIGLRHAGREYQGQF